MLKNKSWPPKNCIKVIEAEGVPVCAILERKTKDDFLGYQALNRHHPVEACKYFAEAVKKKEQNEIIFFNFAAALFDLGDKERAAQMLQRGLEINPESETLLMFQANLLLEKGETPAAVDLYQKLIRLNPKSFDAYIALAKIWTNQEAYPKARELLKSCLVIHPAFKAAIIGLADTYRKTNPGMARKYDELAKSYP